MSACITTLKTLQAIAAVALKETKVFFRDPVFLAFLLTEPVLLIVTWGLVAKTQLREAPWVLLDADGTEASRRLSTDLVVTAEVARPLRASSYADIEAVFKQSRAAAAIVIPRGFSRALRRDEPATVQLVLNGTDPLVAARFSSLFEDFIHGFPTYGPKQSDDLGWQRIAFRSTVRENPRLADDWFFLPIIPAYFITELLFAAACLSIVEERERGTYEHLLALPLRPCEIMVGKAFPFCAVSYGVLVAHFVTIGLAFGIPVRGSLATVCLVSLPFIADCYLIAVLLSAIARNSQQALFLSLFLAFPSIVLSGFMTPLATLPVFIQRASCALPMTHYVSMLRNIVVRGAELGDLGEPLSALGATFVVLLVAFLVTIPRRLA